MLTVKELELSAAEAQLDTVESSEAGRLDWESKSKAGSLVRDFQVSTLAVFNASDRKAVFPAVGDMLV